ncbi:hypothetical protein BV898_04794 [Hypsibius exemplaris]|uniref:Uncharacterized protein n=1 Tax=Hypsibius exemplaris TaxID=2072580 RepID=A0A1W0X1Q5_HYPEX|nr:hypothetical protein BV898_04794 [Hypsibius exemplaris]
MTKLNFIKRHVDGKLNDIRDRLDKYGFDRVVDLHNAPSHKDHKDEIPPTPLAIAKQTNMIEAVRAPAWKDRTKLKQHGVDASRFGIEQPRPLVSTRKPAFLLGTDNQGFMEALGKKPRSKRGYQALAKLEKRWTDQQKKVLTELPAAEVEEPAHEVAQYPKQSPFNTSGERFAQPRRANETPGPAFYDVSKVSVGRRVRAQHKLGHGAILAPPFHIHCSYKKNERCHMCKAEVWCLPSYYTIPARNIFLCPLCYFVERKMAITLQPHLIAKVKRVVDCSTIHTHFPDSDRVLTHATLQEVKWLAKKEHYFHLHYPKERDSIPQPGVWRYPAP